MHKVSSRVNEDLAIGKAVFEAALQFVMGFFWDKRRAISMAASKGHGAMY
jgi:hypothetical protein